MGRPYKPFMIISTLNDKYATTLSGGRIHWDDWEGEQFLTKEDAEKRIKDFGILNVEVIEILDEIRTIIRPTGIKTTVQ